jgi:hypothetical protein
MRPSRPIWEALLTIPLERAAGWTWRHLLDDAWPHFAPLLRRVGQVVDRLPCPGPHGDGCPRHVVTHDDGRVVAVCGDPDGQCDRLVLQKGDSVVLELDHQLLARALGQYLKLKDELLPLQLPNCVWQLGWYEPSAGEQFAVCLLLSASDDQVHQTAIRLRGHFEKPFVLVVPLRKQAALETVDYLRGYQSRILYLEDLLGVEGSAWSALPSTAGALDSFRNDVVGGSRFRMPEHRFPTPTGTTWKDVFIRFVDGHQIHVRALGQSGIFEYTQLGMATMRKSGENQFTVQWKLLADLAEDRGEYCWPRSHNRKPLQKRRERLAKHLQTFFAIEEDPFEDLPRGAGFKARFTISPEQ